MFFDTQNNNHGLKHHPFKALVVPRPIGWISTISASGKPNLAPYSFFNGISDQPPMIAFSSAGNKDTLSNINETGECTCSLSNRALTDEMNLSSAAVNHGVDEFKIASLETSDGSLVSTPRVSRAPAALECKFWKSLELPPASADSSFNYTLVICEVIGIYIDDHFIIDGIVDTAAMQPIARLGYMDYAVVNADSMFTLNRPQVSDDGEHAQVSGEEWDGVYR